ncbi:MAG: protein phosphatase, partial [Actinobacteria bacterium]|nr:protein phosphatase [Actinomycetota bacterium]
MATESDEQKSAPETGAATPPLRLRYAARSDVGLVRQGNEDSGYAGGNMLVVADGMGGHAAGELASSTTIAAFAELDRQPPGESVLTAMADTVEAAHEELSRIIGGAPDFSGMGTTVTAMSWEGDRVAIA